MLDQYAKAKLVINKYVGWSVGAGAIPVPFLDLVTVTGVQLKMLNELAKLYDVAFSENRVKSLVASLVGSIVPTGLAWGVGGSLLKSIPFIGTIAGTIAMPAFAGAATYAVGKVFVQHFESGGTFLDFDPEAVKEHFKQYFEAGKGSMPKDSDKRTATV